VKDLVHRLAESAGLDLEIVCDRSKPEGRFIKSGDSSLLIAALGDNFEWKIPLDEGLRLMIGWYNETFGKSAGC
jgi:UDP-glucose 4-epimerase/GDP-L-fucose synthase